MSGVDVIAWRFTPQDVARVRFAISALWELVLSLIVLRAPGQHALHLPWVRATRSGLGGVDLGELFALCPIRGTVADFLSPPPVSPLAELAEELETVGRTPVDQLVADAADVPGIPSAVLDRIRADPMAARERIVAALRAYWEVALADAWPRIRALLEADVLWRAQRLAGGGAFALFEDLHETVEWQGDRLVVADRQRYAGVLSGEGLLLIPSVMSWPGVRKMVAPYQPAISYPARGIGTLWEGGTPPTSRALAALVGRSRARMLVALAEPQSTTVLARRLSITPGAVSQQLSILKANGLVAGNRVGSSVLYRRTTRADTFLDDLRSGSGRVSR